MVNCWTRRNSNRKLKNISPRTELRNMITKEEVINKEDNVINDSATKEVQTTEAHTMVPEKEATRKLDKRAETTKKTTEVPDNITITVVDTEVPEMTMVPETTMVLEMITVPDKIDLTETIEKVVIIDLDMKIMKKVLNKDPATIITIKMAKVNKEITTEVPVNITTITTETRKVKVVKKDSIDQNVKKDKKETTTTDLPDKTDLNVLTDLNDLTDPRESREPREDLKTATRKKDPLVKTIKVVTEPQEIRKEKVRTNPRDQLADQATLEIKVGCP